jgi:hypothetical protein
MALGHLLEELEEFLVAMPVEARVHHFAGGDLEHGTAWWVPWCT